MAQRRTRRRLEPVPLEELENSPTQIGLERVLRFEVPKLGPLIPLPERQPDASVIVTSDAMFRNREQAGPHDRIMASDASLSSGVRLASDVYETEQGLPIDARQVRLLSTALDGHSAAEHLTYQSIWSAAAQPNPTEAYRDATISFGSLAKATGLSKRNLFRVMESLIKKCDVDILRPGDPGRKVPHTYRVWSTESILERRRAAGFHWVYKNRNVVALVRCRARVSLSSDASLAARDTAILEPNELQSRVAGVLPRRCQPDV
jgi:hypothetical protein